QYSKNLALYRAAEHNDLDLMQRAVESGAMTIRLDIDAVSHHVDALSWSIAHGNALAVALCAANLDPTYTIPDRYFLKCAKEPLNEALNHPHRLLTTYNMLPNKNDEYVPEHKEDPVVEEKEQDPVRQFTLQDL